MFKVFTACFICALLVYFTVKWWLSNRQMRHITQHQNTVPPEFAAQITIKDHQNAAQYALARHRLSRINLILSTLILLFWTLAGGLVALSQYTLSITEHPLHFGVLLIVLFSIINALIDLPMAYIAQFKVEQKFGFNRMTLKLWFMDMLKGTLLSMVIGLPLLYAVLAFFSWLPNTWWLWSWALFVGLNVLMLWLYPSFIAPIFNKFTALDAGALKERLDALLTRCGFSSNGMYVMDGSRRSAHGNAYFTGFGRQKRIVFFDTLLKQLTEPQIEAVLAHELGHFHHKHVLKRMLIVLPMSFLAFALLGYLAKQNWFYLGLGISDSTGMTKVLYTHNAYLIANGLILFSMVLPIFTFLLTPITTSGSRRDEFQADAFAVQNSNGQDLIDALVNMYQENASFVETDPLYSRFYDSHPPALIRIAHIKRLIS